MTSARHDYPDHRETDVRAGLIQNENLEPQAVRCLYAGEYVVADIFLNRPGGARSGLGRVIGIKQACVAELGAVRRTSPSRITGMA